MDSQKITRLHREVPYPFPACPCVNFLHNHSAVLEPETDISTTHRVFSHTLISVIVWMSVCKSHGWWFKSPQTHALKPNLWCVGIWSQSLGEVVIRTLFLWMELVETSQRPSPFPPKGQKDCLNQPISSHQTANLLKPRCIERIVVLPVRKRYMLVWKSLRML